VLAAKPVDLSTPELTTSAHNTRSLGWLAWLLAVIFLASLGVLVAWLRSTRRNTTEETA
jgi:hypothetical protein